MNSVILVITFLMQAANPLPGQGNAKPVAATPAARLSVAAPIPDPTPQELSSEILHVKRVFVDRLTGGETAAQMRDLIISSLQGSKLFIVTENEERADASLRGAAEDLIYTDQFQTSEGVDVHAGQGGSESNSTGTSFNGARSGISRGESRNMNLTVGEKEETSIHERRHEALATVRLVTRDGDVIWSTTQESGGAKFRGASADVAEKITRALTADMERAKRKN